MMKRFFAYGLSILFVFVLFTTKLSLNVDSAVTILPNGNWSFNYVSDDTTVYYQGLSGYSGSQFVTKLNEIISANHHRFSYGGGSGDTGDKLRYTDESPRDSSKVVLLYSGHDISKASLNQNSSWTWNQEHTWAKSHGFPDAKSNPAYCDLHHLRPTYEKINSTRSNLDFGEVANYSGTVKTDELYGSKVISNVVFEPRDAVKGDVARIMMYMDVRYAGKGSEPNLTLNNKTKTSGSALGSGEFGNLDTLLKWHNQDPVDDLEKRRNDRIYELQGNRNPFIDHPEFIEEVYGTEYNGEEPPIIEPDPEEDLEKASIVIDAINSIGIVSLDSKDAIDNAKNLYNKLTSSQKALVTNYTVLLDKISEYEYLLSQQSSTTGYEADFTDLTPNSGGYSANLTRTLEGKEWIFSYGYINGSDVRLGKKGAATVDSRFSSLFSSNSGSTLEMNWSINNATKIEFTFGQSWGTISTLAVLVSYDGGSSFTIAEQISSSAGQISAVVAPGSNMRFALAIIGTTPRLTLQTVTIEVSDEQDPPVNPNIDLLINMINNIGEVSCDLDTLDKLDEIKLIYNALNENDKALVTNYDIYLDKVSTFNNLLDTEITNYDLYILEVYNFYIQDIFSTESTNKYFELENSFDSLFSAIRFELSNTSYIYLMEEYLIEKEEFLEHLDILNKNKTLELLKAFEEFYLQTSIIDFIDDSEYKSVVDALLEELDELENPVEPVNPNIELLINMIDSIGEVSCDLDTLDKLDEIKLIYNALNENDKALVTNYNIYLDKVSTFNNLLEIEITNYDLYILEVYNFYIQDIFSTESTNKYFELENSFDSLFSAIKQELLNTNYINLMEEYLIEKEEFLEHLDILNENKTLELLKAFEEFYLQTSIIDFIDDSEYKSVVDALLEELDELENPEEPNSAIEEFIELSTLSSVKFSVYIETKKIINTSASIRFTGLISKDLYDRLNEDDVIFGLVVNGKTFYVVPVLVNEYGDENQSDNGQFYQYSVIFNNIPLEDFDYTFTAKAFVETSTDTYYMKEKTTTFNEMIIDFEFEVELKVFNKNISTANILFSLLSSISCLSMVVLVTYKMKKYY